MTAGTSIRSRRSILAALGGGAAALAAQVVTGPLAVRAADGDPVLLGHANEGDTTTQINSGGGTALSCSGYNRAIAAFSDTDGSVGVEATAFVGVIGTGLIGVVGDATHEDYPEQQNGIGVLGFTAVGHRPAVLGQSTVNGTGVQGYSTGTRGRPGFTPPKTGVYGYAAQDATAKAVYGHTTAGIGVYARAKAYGKALDVHGRSFFSRSGALSVGAGKSSVTRDNIYLTSTALVLATIQGPVPDGVSVRSVRLKLNSASPSLSSFAIDFNGVTASTPSYRVAWFVLG